MSPEPFGSAASPPAVDLDLLGLALRVEVLDPAGARWVGELLADFPPAGHQPGRTLRLLIDSGGKEGCWELYDEDSLVRGGMRLQEAIAMLLWQLNQIVIGTRHHVVLHAGCVALEGRGVVLSSPMETGKSTLVTALVLDGFDYLSDEFAALSLGDDRLCPVACPIALDAGSFPLFPHLQQRIAPEFNDPTRWHLRAGAIRPGSPSGPVPAAVVVLPRYLPDAVCRVKAIPPRDAVVALATQALNLPSLGGLGFQALARLVNAVPTYQLVFGDLGDACSEIASIALARAT